MMIILWFFGCFIFNFFFPISLSTRALFRPQSMVCPEEDVPASLRGSFLTAFVGSYLNRSSLQYQVPINFISRLLTWETGVVHYWFWNSDFKNPRDGPAICQRSRRSRRLWAIKEKMMRFFYHFWIGVSVEDAKTRQFVTSSHLLVVVTINNMWNRIEWKWKSYYFSKTLIRKHRSHVNISESFSEASDFSMRCALWRLNKEMVLTHTIRIRERSEMEKENSGFHDPLASKAYLRKASSNSLFYCVFFSIYGAYICLCNSLLSNVLYTGCILDLI